MYVYTEGTAGLFPNYAFDDDPESFPVGIQTQIVADGMPLFAVRDDAAYAQTAIAAIYCDDPAQCTSINHWHYVIRRLLDDSPYANMSNALAITDVHEATVAGTRYADAIFTLDTDCDLYETRFKCADNNGVCNGGFELTPVTHHDLSSIGDHATDSLSASWHVADGVTWARAYVGVSGSSALTLKTDVVTPSTPIEDDWVSGTSGWGGAHSFMGNQAPTVRNSLASRDESYAVITISTATPTNFVGPMFHGWSGTNFDWQTPR